MSLPATPWIDRTGARLRAWPPPAGDTAYEAARLVRAADRHGHVAHLAAAVAFVVCCALDQAPASVALGVLLGTALLRLLFYPEAFTPILRQPVLWLAAAWFSWSLLSMLWAPPGATSPVRSLATQRMLLGAAVLWPVIGHARMLAYAIVVAASVNALMQLAQNAGIAVSSGTSPLRPSGFVQLPVVASVWSVVAIGMSLALWVEARTWTRVALAAAVGLCASGIALAASRGPVLAAIPAGAVLLGLLVFNRHARPSNLAAPLGIAATCLAITLLLPGADLLEYARAALQDPRHPAALSIELRFFWWERALELFTSHPVRGGGLGSFAPYIESHPATPVFATEAGIPLWHVLQFHPHSMYLRALAEQGAIGLGLLLCYCAAMVAAGWRGARADAVGSAAFAGVVFALLLAASECIEVMNLAYALTAVLGALCVFPREVRRGRP